jgi:hypothetical protein
MAGVTGKEDIYKPALKKIYKKAIVLVLSLMVLEVVSMKK